MLAHSVSSKAGRRKQSLTFAQRIEILKRINDGEKCVNLSREFNVAKSTISGIKKNESEILRKRKILEESDCDLNFRKRYKGTEETEMEKSVFEWFCKNRHSGVPVTGPVLQTVAREINDKLQENPNFKASTGWLRGFKARHNLLSLNIKDENSPANSKASEEFKNTFAGFMSMMRITNLDHIYNCDEIVFDWKLAQNVTRDENLPAGGLDSKNKLTIIVCTNASGTHKIPLFIVGHSKNPQFVQNKDQLPIYYTPKKYARMDKTIFIDWYSNCFIPAVQEKYKNEDNSLRIILLMDTSPHHPPEDLERINNFCTLVYLPSNVTSIIQPMKKGIVEKFKRSYKCNFLKHLLTEKSDVDFDDALKSIQLTNSFDFCTEAWATLTSQNIRHSWKNLIPFDEDDDDDDDDDNDDDAEPDNEDETPDLRYVQRLLSSLPDMDDITLEETIQWLDCGKFEDCFTFHRDEENNSQSSNDDKFDETAIEENEAPVSFLEAYNAVNILKRFIRQRARGSFTEPGHVVYLEKYESD